MQLSACDNLEFRKALHRGGMTRVHKAVGAIDARNANASVQSDIDMIVGAISESVGMDTFNDRVREGLLGEYRRISLLSLE